MAADDLTGPGEDIFIIISCPRGGVRVPRGPRLIDKKSPNLYINISGLDINYLHN